MGNPWVSAYVRQWADRTWGLRRRKGERRGGANGIWWTFLLSVGGRTRTGFRRAFGLGRAPPRGGGPGEEGLLLTRTLRRIDRRGRIGVTGPVAFRNRFAPTTSEGAHHSRSEIAQGRDGRLRLGQKLQAAKSRNTRKEETKDGQE